MSSSTFWVAANGDGVRMGDTVALHSGNGVIVAVTAAGWPIVELTAGKFAGEHLGVRPSEILSRIAIRRRPQGSARTSDE